MDFLILTLAVVSSFLLGVVVGFGMRAKMLRWYQIEYRDLIESYTKQNQLIEDCLTVVDKQREYIEYLKQIGT